MNSAILGVINLIHESDEMETLTASRCLATVPFGARFRLIDFTLSSMVNSGINKVGVFAQTKYRSLMDHLGSGKHWDLHHRQSGLFIMPPVTDDVNEVRRGDLYHFYQHRDFFARSTHEYVLVTRSHMICNLDFEGVLASHKASGADITVICKEQTELFGGRARKVQVDERGRVTAMQDHFGRMESDLVSMEMYLMRKELLLELVDTSLAQGQDHLVRHAIMSRVDKLHIQCYAFEGYLGVVNTLNSYYQNSMQLLRPEVWKSLFYEPGPVFTKVKDEPPARYAEGAKTINSLVANGCIIEGTVINSILFRGVHVRKGAVVRNSIVMQNGVIGESSSVNHAILDKDVTVERSRELYGAEASPFIAMKRRVI
ncbi:glucose-1-phosphate adenylyltransferase subunit GlgD [Paenibacillus sp. MWE-103]|uniref:Glucose-1-phosphate adenylyltransferase subunit GlgD n=1 Tax=Paenibacillus artemisiicola TaxID=1172618 RepID=A0ABS3W9F4_9BACL|nr:glucose-1-phosphate adenylyltransferase subunit GlgD [Paenibacillus artemisiicola]MBO7744945.1 glucose-1-phosphate adenylyltransferase subunit GlgD [Paenibacillus artemisiicola]